MRQIEELSFWGNGDLAEVDTNMVLTWLQSKGLVKAVLVLVVVSPVLNLHDQVKFS